MWIPTEGQLSYEIRLGKVPSLNAFYAGRHWVVRSKFKDKYVTEALEQLALYDLRPLKQAKVYAYVNYRYDVDNSIMAVKFALDAFRKWGGIKDDTKAYIPQIKIAYDPSLPIDTSKIIIEGIQVSQ